ncbi:hypothetical protein H310_03563 [Aphanomyces invadans]|uniref:CDP-alcohol phosphatidyltransferase n=1 Tax=Aphanomyces invadans TaxID=157072 RepID=A0A024UK12_9STRA|nr:hypothetical protein H310_03563 [Aphanomyces invadans]ETW05923.1 hypothetical protein H310_03563 [Aphanomyces invadans]|eukprot:XP_008865700.1 hypothetical protein H310_03563 [Aphanomyces invadans]
MGVLSKQALEGIAAYKYKAGSYTFLDLQLNHFWNAMVEFLPLWMAPNLVTLTGTIIVVFTTALLLVISPKLEGGAPGWAYVLSGVGLFVYQTLDAIDGKQARRTGSSSPLGQLFDHGCDALSAMLNCLTAFVAFRAGNSTYTFAGLSSVSINFFFAQWDEYHTGTMSCGNGYYGVTEGQLTLIGCLLLTAAVGDDMWLVEPLPFASITCGQLFISTCFASNVVLVYANIKNVFSAAPLAGDQVGHKELTRGHAMVQLIPVVAVLVGGCFTMLVGPTRDVYLSHPLVLMWPFGLNFVLMSSRMIVCHMSKVPFSMQSRILVPLAMFLAVVYAPDLVDVAIATPLVASLVYAAIVTAVYVHYILSAVFEICAHLKIDLLTLPAKKSE